MLSEKNLLVSIITVVFNGEKYLQQTIDSVARQTYKNIEYLIIDGGSTDSSVEIIKNNADLIDIWISEKDEGIADAFNKGLARCRGEIIGLVNADDWLEPNAVEFVVRNIGDADVMYGETTFWYDDRPVATTHGDHSKLRLGMTVSHPASFVRRTAYDRFGKFDPSLKIAMDYELFLRFLHQGAIFKKGGTVLTNMRRGGVSDERWGRAIKEEYRVKNRYYNSMANVYYFVRQVLVFTAKDILRRFNCHKP